MPGRNRWRGQKTSARPADAYWTIRSAIRFPTPAGNPISPKTATLRRGPESPNKGACYIFGRLRAPGVKGEQDGSGVAAKDASGNDEISGGARAGPPAREEGAPDGGPQAGISSETAGSAQAEEGDGAPAERPAQADGPAAKAAPPGKDEDGAAQAGARGTSSGAETGGEPRITMARGAYLGLVATAIAGIAVGAFFAGYVVSSDNDYVTRAQLDAALASAVRPAPASAPAAPPRPALVSADDDPVLGMPDAPVTIVEFSDFECPFCSRFYKETLPLIKATYIEAGAAKLVYRDFPIDRIHPNARVAHAAAECADEQGKFWPYHDVLFDRQGEWSPLAPELMRERVSEYARLLSLDASAFAECLDSPETDAEIEADKRDGSSYGATGTPAFFVGSDSSGYVLISGAKPFESFAAAIESALG